MRISTLSDPASPPVLCGMATLFAQTPLLENLNSSSSIPGVEFTAVERRGSRSVSTSRRRGTGSRWARRSEQRKAGRCAPRRSTPNASGPCRVAVTLRPSSDSDIKMELWLPVENWNGKFEMVGNGGWAGIISFPQMAAALRDGYATASTDTGPPGRQRYVGAGASGKDRRFRLARGA